MYTQCPECKTPRPITVAELRKSHGMVSCEACSNMFDTLELLDDGDAPENIETNEFSSSLNHTVKSSNTSDQHSTYWGIGSALLIFVFIFQIYFFEAHKLSQNSSLRPWLNKICAETTHCQLPQYKNLDEISILKGSFDAINDHYVFKAAFINQSAFSQAQPSIKLTLIDFSGQSFAERIFDPKDYSKQPNALLNPNISNEIILTIATPFKKTGGYRFELI